MLNKAQADEKPKTIVEYVHARDYAGSAEKAERLLVTFNARVNALLPPGVRYEARQATPANPGSDETREFQALGISMFAISDAWEDCVNAL